MQSDMSPSRQVSIRRVRSSARETFRRAVHNSRRDPYALSTRRAEQMVRILDGIVGMQLRLLLVPITLLYLRKRRRKVTVEMRRRTTSAQTTSMLVDYCLLHPFLAPLGRPAMTRILDRSRRQCYHPDDVLLCPREPARSAGLVICTTGKLLVRSRPEGEGASGMDRVMHAIRSGGGASTTSNLFYGDMIGLPPDSEVVMSAPVVIGALRTLTDLANPHLVTAQTTVDAFIIPYDALHAAFAGADFSPSDVAPWRGLPGLGAAKDDDAPPSDASSRYALPDPSHVLAPRLLVLQTQFRMSPLFLKQSWLLHSTPLGMFQAVSSTAESMCFAPGQQLVERGKPPPGVMFLRRGVARVVGDTTTSQPHRQVYVMPGSVLGERSTVFHARCKESIVAVSFCDVWVLHRSDVDRFRSETQLNSAWNTNGIAMAVQWLTNMRNAERAQVLQRRVKQEEELLLQTAGTSFKQRGVGAIVLPPTTDDSELPAITQRIVGGLRTVPYLKEAPLALLVELADAASPQVFLPHCAITTTSEWADKLCILTKGTATVQHGLTARPSPPNTSWVYRAGSCVGMECVVEHRTLFPICSVSMVEAWTLSRAQVRLLLSAYGLLSLAEAQVECVLNDLQLLLSHRVHSRPSSGSRPPLSTPRRVLSPTQTRPVSPDTHNPPTTHSDAFPDNFPVEICGLEYLIDFDNADINRGVVGLGPCLWFLSIVETARHGRYGKMFPEASALLGSHNPSDQVAEDRRHAERYRALAVEVLALDIGDPNNGQDSGNSVAEALTRTFNEANARADEEQKLREAESAAQWEERSVDSSSESDEDPLAQTLEQRSMQQVHMLPHTFLVVETSEAVGDRSPWLLQLLGRHGGIWGYLEGSEPDLGTMVAARVFAPTAASMRLRALGSVLSLSMLRGRAADARASQTDELAQSLLASRRSHAAPWPVPSSSMRSQSGPRLHKSRKHPQSGGALTVAAYKPENPHGYNVRLPDVIERLGSTPQILRNQREILMASAVVGRMQRASTAFFTFGQGGGGSPKAERGPSEPFDADVIAKVLQQSGVATSGASSTAATREANHDDLRDTDYFDEDWDLMMRGLGVYNDGSPKTLRLDAARKKRLQQTQRLPEPPPLRRESHTGSSRRYSASLVGEQELPPSEVAAGLPDGTDSRPPVPSARRHTLLRGLETMSTPFLDNLRIYLGRASARLEVGTKRAVDELERPTTPSDQPSETPQPDVPLQDARATGEPKLLLARRPRSGRGGGTTGTRCALIVPTQPPARNVSSARTRKRVVNE